VTVIRVAALSFTMATPSIAGTPMEQVRSNRPES
jgi:hypothetical protein